MAARVHIRSDADPTTWGTLQGHVTAASAAGSIEIEFTYGTGKAALATLERLYEDAKRQIEETL